MNLEGIVTDAVARFILDLKRRIEALEARDTPRYLPEVTTTWDPASLTAGSTTLVDVAVVGAVAGDRVEVTHTGLGTFAMKLWGNATTDSVRVFLRNVSGSTVNIGSGTLRVKVEKV